MSDQSFRQLILGYTTIRMSDRTLRNHQLNRRLLPLYIASFFESFVLWYSIEKLFMRSIGFSNTQIGLMVAVYSVVMLLVDTPSGIIADRWSRKGVLILASISLGLAGLFGGVSHSISVYLFSAVFWGIFFACYSGMYESIIYDTIIESNNDKNMFQTVYGRMQGIEGVALVFGGLIGGFVASHYGLRLTYFMSIPLCLISIVALWIFHEPKIHRNKQTVSLRSQLSATHVALNNQTMVPVVISLVIRAILAYCIFEFSQLWLLALHTQTIYYGLASAFVLSSLGLGGFLVHRFHLDRRIPLLLTLGIMVASCIGLILFRHTEMIVISQLILATGLIALYILFSSMLHDNVPSSIRASAASATSTIGRFFIIPTALLIGYVSQRYSIYTASYIFLGLMIALVYFVLQITMRQNMVEQL